MPVRATRWGGLCAALALGCIGDLDPKELVVSPRILDIVADPPELAPGGTVRLRAVIGGSRGPVTYRWVACTASDPFSGIGGFGTGTGEQGCTGDAGLRIPLGSGPEATLTIPRESVDLEAIVSRLGERAPRELVERFIRDVGVIVGIGLTVEADGRTLNGYKRVVVSLNPRPNANPPPPRVRVNTRWVSVPSTGGDVCVPEEGEGIRVPRARNVTLTPDPAEAWLERYTVLTTVGAFEERSEQAFYSWYATNGELGRGLTRSPTRDNVWLPSDHPGAQSLWLFIRDGHGGTSGCRLDLTVE
nr:hypothetical protein [Deltaproteobacteria bacterium]